ncbi:glycoside hydrolase 100 family protein [Mucilaginibacter auburnensis]|uniref:beta-fructofuranosidase n=1 Tax=Mucilaginibacter auburnensis TaxID=1457233 RepID=A0A2H9VW92_9SPHI|nr:glycoside hydrolase 100 family protein [Mucilaginibacter auburnensis]PJJ85062.1 uridine kinase [Mucilaginibacter auburnensis]
MKATESKLTAGAVEVIEKAASMGYLLASGQQIDNYRQVWARDSAVTILAILASDLKNLFTTAANTLKLLQQQADSKGQIPSNVQVNEAGEIEKVSFGGLVGRTDSSFWWLIASLTYLKKVEDVEFASKVEAHAFKIFDLAEAWEFNGKQLMYLPMSGNWADEYVTHGYVLYDQLLRYWALQLAAERLKNNELSKKATVVKAAIKQHFLFEQPLDSSLYPIAQRQKIGKYNLSDNFIASFSPGDRVERYDAWSIALLLLLQIPSEDNRDRLAGVIKDTFDQFNSKGIPAFWPEIMPKDSAYEALSNNYSYRFKNKPGHFHNGGIWPVANGFLVTALNFCGKTDIATQLFNAMQSALEIADESRPFTEYFELYSGEPCGTPELCFSASGYLMAATSQTNMAAVNRLLPGYLQKTYKLQQKYSELCAAILAVLPVVGKNVMVISIAGQSGSGKTTLAYALKRELQQLGVKTILLHQDDYFKLPPKQNHMAREKDFGHIGYDEVRLEVLDEHIRQIKLQQHSTITIPRMNWVKDVEEQMVIDIKDAQVVLVEGTYTSLLSQPRFKIFFNADYRETRESRAGRGRDKDNDFIEQVLQKESGLISMHEDLANLVLNNQLEVVTYRE